MIFPIVITYQERFVTQTCEDIPESRPLRPDSSEPTMCVKVRVSRLNVKRIWLLNRTSTNAKYALVNCKNIGTLENLTIWNLITNKISKWNMDIWVQILREPRHTQWFHIYDTMLKKKKSHTRQYISQLWFWSLMECIQVRSSRIFTSLPVTNVQGLCFSKVC